jgi:hypothetical protein
VHSILEDSGWSAIDIKPLDVECTLPARELDTYVTRLGPVGRALQTADAATRSNVLEKIRPAFAPYLRKTEVRFVAACWMIGARRAQ